MEKRRLLETLNDFEYSRRRQALLELLDRKDHTACEKPWVNMHMHSFFSFHGESWSPCRLAWEAFERGLYAAGLCDFDTLDGLGEFDWVCVILGLRHTVSLETRVFFSDCARREINSPGEPGIAYLMGAGFTASPERNSTPGLILADMAEKAHLRNRQVVERINRYLDGLKLDYDKDVLPLTPSGNPTERHIVRAYYDKALEFNGGSTEKAIGWWASKLDCEEGDLREKSKELNQLLDFLRSRLIKKGGIGYVEPTAESFPSLEEVVEMTLQARAVPVYAWLDGASDAESDPSALLEQLMAKGVRAVNIIPDRNWNYEDRRVAEEKAGKMHDFVSVADQLGLPILAGTEMNRPGQRVVDDFTAEPMRKVSRSFLFGAQVMVGHVRLLNYADCSYTDRRVEEDFADRKKQNEFFAAIGGLPEPDAETRSALENAAPGRAYAALSQSAQAGRWLS